MWCTYMRHQTAMFSEANLLRLYNHWKHCIKYVIKTPVKYFILFRYYDILWVSIYLWLQFWIFVSLHTESPHTDHMLQLANIAGSALFLPGLSRSRSRNIFQLAMFAHNSHFFGAAEIRFISNSSWATQLSLTLFLLLLIIPTFQLNWDLLHHSFINPIQTWNVQL